MIKPFSHNYYKNSKHCRGDQYPCGICGKPINTPQLDQYHWLTVVDGGARFANPNEQVDETDPGYMGNYPIGPDCWRQYQKDLKMEAHNE